MSLTCIDWEADGITVLNFSGNIALGEGTRKFRQCISETIESGVRNILINLAEVYYIDSSGLGEMVRAYKEVTARGGRLKLLKVSQRASDLLELTRVYTLFEVFKDEATAIRSFHPETKTADSAD